MIDVSIYLEKNTSTKHNNSKPQYLCVTENFLHLSNPIQFQIFKNINPH